MADQLIVIEDDEIGDGRLARVEQIGRVANQVAADHVFTDYLNRKSDHTIETQAAALNVFGEYLVIVGITGLLADTIQHCPQVWQGITWGIVEGFVK